MMLSHNNHAWTPVINIYPTIETILVFLLDKRLDLVTRYIPYPTPESRIRSVRNCACVVVGLLRRRATIVMIASELARVLGDYYFTESLVLVLF